MKKNITILLFALILFLVSTSSSAQNASSGTKIIDNKYHTWTVKFNMPISASALSKDAILITDTRGNILNTAISPDPTSGSQLKLRPLEPYEAGVKYFITVHKDLTHSSSGTLREDYVQPFVLDLNLTLEYANNLYKNSLEGVKPGDWSYGSRSEFRTKLDSIGNAALRAVTDSEKLKLIDELTAAIEVFNSKKIMGSTGEIVVPEDKKSQAPQSISFEYHILSKYRDTILSELSGIQATVYGSHGAVASYIINKNNYVSIAPVEPNLPPEDIILALKYENIDVSTVMSGLSPGDYILKLRPIFTGYNKDLVPYTSESSILIVSSSVLETPEWRYLPWFNILELKDNQSVSRYELTFKLGNEDYSFVYGAENLVNQTRLNGYLMRPYQREGYKLLVLDDKPEVANLLELAKKSGIPLSLEVKALTGTGSVLSSGKSIKSLDFRSSVLPQITSVYNLTSEQEKDVLNPNVEYEILPVRQGDMLSIETNKKSTLYAYKILLEKDNLMELELPMREFIEDTRYVYDMTENGFYSDFKASVQSVYGTTPLVETSVSQKYSDSNGKGIITVDTNTLPEGQYLLVLADSDGLYYPLENLLVNMIKDVKPTVSEPVVSGGFLEFTVPGTPGVYENLSAYIITESQYFDFLYVKNEVFLRDLQRNNSLSGSFFYTYEAGDAVLKLKLNDNLNSGAYFLVVYKDSGYIAKPFFIN